MKQDQNGKIWLRNRMVGYVEDDELYGLNPLTNRFTIVKWDGLNAVERLEKWLKPLQDLI